MSRFLGPRLKVARALGIELPGLTTRTLERRPYPPGQHGVSPRRRKISPYRIRLDEKQKLRFNYGLTERQLRNLVRRAAAGSSNTGERLLELLEARLDNVVFRAGFAATIPAARQLVNHGHITIDGRRERHPAVSVRRGQRIGLSTRGEKMEHVLASLARPRLIPPSWLQIDAETRTAAIAATPDGTGVPMPLDVRLVVEFYAQRA